MNDTGFFIPKEVEEELIKLEEKARIEHIPIIQPEVAQFLKVMIKIKKPLRILEVGTAIGYSTTCMAYAAGKDVEIVTVEIDEDMAERAAKNFLKLGVSEQINLKIGDALKVLPCLRREFDFVFIDAAKGQYLNYLEMILEILSQDGMIIADNVLYKGYVANKRSLKRKNITMVRRLEEYIEVVSDHPILESSVLELGDGLAISVRR
ncbi:O-methyltransferase [Natronospora cellulosivora (SeqCode)]